MGGNLSRRQVADQEQQKSLSIQRQIESLLWQHDVTPRFFFGSPLLEGFSIIHDQTPYVVINKSLPPEIQLQVAKRELAHIQLGHLTEGQSSLFLSELQKYQAEMKAKTLPHRD